MKFISTKIKGLFEIHPDIRKDSRGDFFKTFHVDTFESNGMPTQWAEEYVSHSSKNVLRGMHFQVPPMHHHKIVTCLSGAVLDVVVDLRIESTTYQQVYATELNDEKKSGLFIPKGCAHGFLSLQDDSLMFYKVSTVYSPDHDKGILWNSIHLDWPVSNPILSERDKKHPSLQTFISPFL
ncbi:dTDP-4-dehydrorhamnose 3,5-epimerase [Flagellimonas marinaquae]